MFCRSKLLICFHAVAFFSIRVISAMYTNHIDARSINVNSDIGKKFYMTLLFMILIMIVNIWELLKNWIDSRKKEFYIRRIVGADKKPLFVGLYRDNDNFCYSWYSIKFPILLAATFV